MRLLASFEGRVNYEANTTYFFGLVWVVLVVTLGARSIQAAITAGLSFVLFAPLLDQFTPLNQTTTQAVAFILFGLGALTYAKHPEGIIEAQTRRLARTDACDGSNDCVGKPPEPEQRARGADRRRGDGR